MQNRRWSSMIFFDTLMIMAAVSVAAVTAGRNIKGLNLGDTQPTYTSSSGGKGNLPRRLFKLQGREVIPAMSNAIPGEPTCEELRAMWRYYKRQSRAEVNNEIPQFGTDIFLGNYPSMFSFGLFKGLSSNRLRGKNRKQYPYGHVLTTPRQQGRNNGRKGGPFEEVRSFAMSNRKNAKLGANANSMRKGVGGEEASAPLEPIVHFSPPAQPTKETSLQKIKDIFREERIKEKGADKNTNKEFGKVVLSPPEGHDGRVANKPKELMTPFEKIRFGHVDDILDEGIRPNLDLSKRRVLPVSMLKLRPLTKQRRRNQQTDISDAFLRSPPTHSLWNNNNMRIRDNIDDMIIQSDSDPEPFGNFFSSELNDAPETNDFIDRPDEALGQNNQNQLDLSSCSAVEGQLCNANSDCFCVGFGLYRCNFGQCQVLSFFSAVRSDESSGDLPSASMWHSEPLPSSQLGKWEDAINFNNNGQKRDIPEGKAN